MKKNIIGKLITIITVIAVTIEVGVAIAYCMLVKIDFNKYSDKYIIEIIK